PQKRFLDTIGDKINQAFYPTSAIDSFQTGRILYAKIDTLYNNGASRDSIYVFSTDEEDAKYNLSFLEVGYGFGNYIPDLNGANGKVYKWVAPVNGMKQGSYEPAVFLVTPKSQQVVSLGAEYAVSEHTQVSTELAMSDYDVNRFSTRDKENDKGFAGKLNLKNSVPVGNSAKGRKLITNLG